MLKFISFQGPSSLYFKDPDTGQEFKAHTKPELVKLIRNYRAQNNLEEIDYLSLALDDYLCRQSENAGKCAEINLKRGFFEYVSGGMALLKNVFYGSKNMVDQVTAEERASVCVKCPYNTIPAEEGFEAYTNRLAEAMTGGRKVSVHGDLGECAVCFCCMRAKVFSKGPFKLSEEDRGKMAEVGCWQVK